MVDRALRYVLGPETEWPHFTEAQVAWLERAFPARCLTTNETVEDHLRYAGKVDLVALMRTRVSDPSTPEGLAAMPDELSDEERRELNTIQFE